MKYYIYTLVAVILGLLLITPVNSSTFDCTQNNAFDNGDNCNWPISYTGTRCCCWCSDPTGGHSWGHIMDVGNVVADKDVYFEIRPGAGDANCVGPGYMYYSLDGITWNLFWSSPLLAGWTTYSGTVHITDSFRYVRANTETCPVDWSTVILETTVAPPIADFIATPGTAPLTVQFTDTSTGSPTTWLWNFGDGSTSLEKDPVHTYTSAGSYTVSLTVTYSAGSNTQTKSGYITVSTTPPGPNLDSGLVAQYLFNGNANDNTGHGHDGTVYGPIMAPDRFGNPNGAYYFDGSDDYIEVPDDPELKPQSVSLVIWVNIDPAGSQKSMAGSDGYIIFKRNVLTANFEGYQISASPSVIHGTVSSTSGKQVTGYIPCTPGEWHQIVMTADSQYIKMYLDGEFVSEEPTGFPLNYAADNLYFGNSQEWFYKYYHGLIDEISIYNTILSADEIHSIYSNTAGQPPIAAFEASPTSGTAPLKVTFTDQSTGDGLSSRVWQYKLTSDSTWTTFTLDETSSFTFTDAGSYDVKLTVTGTGGSDDEVKLNYISVMGNQPPIASFKSYNLVETEAIEGPHMAGGKIIFIPEGSIDPDGNIVKYDWDFGNGQKQSETSPDHWCTIVYSDPEIYTVTLTVTDDSGAQATATEILDLTLEPGDLLFLRSGPPFSTIFNLIGNTYTHVGMYVGKIRGTHYMVESAIKPIGKSLIKKDGVQLTTFDRWSVENKETYADAVRVNADPEIKNRAVAWATSKQIIGSKYDLDSITGNTKQVDSTYCDSSVKGHEKSTCKAQAKAYYCSELVWAAYYVASDGQIDLSRAYGEGAIPPDGLLASQYIDLPPLQWHHEHRPV